MNQQALMSVARVLAGTFCSFKEHYFKKWKAFYMLVTARIPELFDINVLSFSDQAHDVGAGGA